MNCSSGKTTFDSKELAEEALIQNHIRNNHRPGTGPQNIYVCGDCGMWHFTSKGPVSPLLQDEEVKDRIAKEKRSQDWETRFR